LALEPSGNSASGTSGDEKEVREPSLSPRTRPGFSEAGALFRPYLDLPVELRALRGLIDPAFLRLAAARAEALGIGADTIVARSAVIDSDAMVAAYAADLGVEIDPLEDAETTGHDPEIILSTGVLPAEAQRNDKRPTIALGGTNIETLYAIIERNPLLAKRFRISSDERLRSLIKRSSAEKLADNAAFGLRRASPQYSAGHGRFNTYVLGLFAAMGLAALSYYFAFKAVFFAIEAVLALTFLSWSALRIYACLIRPAAVESIPVSDKDLPVYTILVPLHREAAVAADLVASISALNYPHEKLDVKLILEADDRETIAVLRGINLDPCFEIFISPDRGPRTKPKALRAALPFSRGTFVVVYDAEDRPHPEQLREACSQFLSGGEKLACVQAKLAIDNERVNFLTAHFRAEYSGLFDVLLPALVRLRLPVPLGGTSNHFRIDALRRVGGWDPHNVTEDADLGVRLARFGYATDVVDSTTWEEAPARLGAWLMQRTRWMKGWVQTYVVHMRQPTLLHRQLGARGFWAFQLLIGGTVLAALVHPIFALWLIKDIVFGSLLAQSDLLHTAQKGLIFITLAGGYFGSGLLALIGLRRRGQLSSAWIVLTIPLYWPLLSAAAWRAIWKLLVAPYQWEKTSHGIAARNSDARI
jgi:cellulose synthase/poly-beta-1,6-N-acetylglucosamine synthase-like glycosyltransferase